MDISKGIHTSLNNKCCPIIEYEKRRIHLFHCVLLHHLHATIKFKPDIFQFFDTIHSTI